MSYFTTIFLLTHQSKKKRNTHLLITVIWHTGNNLMLFIVFSSFLKFSTPFRRSILFKVLLCVSSMQLCLTQWDKICDEPITKHQSCWTAALTQAGMHKIAALTLNDSSTFQMFSIISLIKFPATPLKDWINCLNNESCWSRRYMLFI